MRNFKAVNYCSLLSDETRFSILQALAKAGPEGLTLKALAQAVELSPKAIRNRIQRLADAHLLETNRKGRHLICTPNRDKIFDLISTLQQELLGQGGELRFEQSSQGRKEGETKTANLKVVNFAHNENRASPKDLNFSSLRDRLNEIDIAGRFSGE